MKKVGSVMALFARETLGKVLAVLALMCVVQAGVYYAAVQKMLDACQNVAEDSYMRFMPLVPTVIVSWLALMWITWMLVKQGVGSGSKPIYTLRRLQLTERQIWACQAVYQVLVYFLFWAVLTVLYFGLIRCYLAALPAPLVSSQTLFLMAYQQPYLHGLLPLADGWGWVRNLIWIVTLGMSTATASYQLRRNKPAITTLILLGTIMILGRQLGLGNTTGLALGIGVPVLLVVIELCFLVFYKHEEEEKTSEQGGDGNA